MLFEDFICNAKILTVLKLNWDHSDADALPRKYHAISFRVKGNAFYTYNNNTLSVKNGDILFVPQNMGYHINAQDEELYVIHFELPEKEQNHLEVFHMKDFVKVKNLFETCLEVWNKKEPGYDFKTLSIFYNILTFMTISSLQTQTDETYQKIEPSIKYLHAHFTEPGLSVLTLCELVRLSDTWFRKLFYKCYGTKPTRYINTLRINYAKELLESGYYSIEKIAEMSGFEDAKYFSTVFRQFTGCAPSKYIDSN